jgi:hypothetical protein
VKHSVRQSKRPRYLLTYPVTATTKADTLGTHAEGEYLRGNDPRNGSYSEMRVSTFHPRKLSLHTPGIGKVDDENPNKHNGYPARGFVFIESSLVGTNDTGDNEVTRCHSNRTGNQNLLTSNLVNPKNGRDSKEELDNAHHTGGEERDGVAAELHILENVGPAEMSDQSCFVRLFRHNNEELTRSS